MEQHRNEGMGETGDPRENPPTNGIVRHDSHYRKSSDPVGRLFTVNFTHEAEKGPYQTRLPLENLKECAVCRTRFLRVTGTYINPYTVDIDAYLYRQIKLFASHQGEPGSIPGRVIPRFSQVESCQTMALVGGFLGDLPFPPPLRSGSAPFTIRFTLIGSQHLIRGLRTQGPRDSVGERANLVQPITRCLPGRLHVRRKSVSWGTGSARLRACQVGKHTSKPAVRVARCPWRHGVVSFDVMYMNSVRQDKPNTERMTQLPQSIPELYEEEVDTSTQQRNQDLAIASSPHATSHLQGGLRIIYPQVGSLVTELRSVQYWPIITCTRVVYTNVYTGSEWANPRFVNLRNAAYCSQIPLTSGIVQYDSHVRESRSDPEFINIYYIVQVKLDFSPPTNVNWVQSSAGSLPDFRKWELFRTMPLVGGFSRGSPVSPTLAFRRCFILTSSQYLVVESRPNLLTQHHVGLLGSAYPSEREREREAERLAKHQPQAAGRRANEYAGTPLPPAVPPPSYCFLSPGRSDPTLAELSKS
ncbi:hypothetical protein PR048_028008 [Dryococelus australis]|uniref:APCDD1 domain-containing protein n=1 Tax=Dryococelus australis TaxID=614101 RepID=A0ABQ9GI39_9NEOP|nr:hypothetical protein PR048_028008 [Dryococelus australis]